MDRISVNSLFPSNYKSEQLNTNNMFNLREIQDKNKLNFNIEKLIKLRENRKKKIFIHYEKIFNLCLNKIDLANNMNKTETIYEVPNGIYGSFDYKPFDCLEFIEEKLKKMHLDILILNEKTIYISWINLEENIKFKH